MVLSLILGFLSLTTTVICLWVLYRQHQTLRDFVNETKHDYVTHVDRFNDLGVRVEALKTLLSRPAPPAPEMYAFLPDSVAEAELEKEILRSEDRSIGAARRFSSRPSPTSGNPSRRVASTRRAPFSGTG